MKYLGIIIILFISFITKAQSPPTGNGREFLGNNYLQTTSSNYFPITLVDRQGSSIKTVEIQQAIGSPYFSDKWQIATLTTVKGTVYDTAKIKIHLQANEIHLKKDEKVTLIVDTGIIRKISFIYGLEKINFENGFQSINKNTVNTYYKVLAYGKYTLLCHIEKVFKKYTNEYTKEQNNEFVEYKSHYVQCLGTMYELNTRKSKVQPSIKKLLKIEDDTKFEAFIKNKNIGNVEDVIDLFKTLN